MVDAVKILVVMTVIGSSIGAFFRAMALGYQAVTALAGLI